MRNTNIIPLLLSVFVLLVNLPGASAQTARESGTSAVKSTFTYGNNKDYAGQNTDLKADLYKPGLFSVKLPVVLLYHGGGYASGDRNLAVMRVFADYFTANNISAIIPDFRQGWYESSTKPLCESVTPEKFEDAAHRAYQDERALIRYCKANANTLGIDSNKIFLFGISSGGFLVLHQLYLNDAAVDADRIARLGSLDFQSNTLTNSTDVAGIISVVGGFYKKEAPIVKSYPTLLFNNSCDGAVDFYNGWLGNCSNTVRSYGPGIFTKILEQYNTPYDLHVFCGFNHGFNSDEMPLGGDADAIDYLNRKCVEFIRAVTQNSVSYATHIASDSIASSALGECRNFETFYWCKKDSLETGNNTISLTPNPISCLLQPKLNIRHPQDETLYLEVIDASGKIISRQKTEYKTSQNVIYLNVTDFTSGINFLLVKNGSGKVLYKTKVMRYCEY
jgi:hypothetical protein